MRVTDSVKFSLALVITLSLMAGLNHVAIQRVSAQATSLPSYQLKFGVFTARFDPGGTFTLQGQGWPALNGNWKSGGSAEVELMMSGGPGGCDGPGRYQFRLDGKHVKFTALSDECRVRQLILNGSDWAPADEPKVIPTRAIKLTRAGRAPSRARSGSAAGSWPSFRGHRATGIGEGQNLPDQWNAKTGENILWRMPIPGLATRAPEKSCGDWGAAQRLPRPRPSSAMT